MEHLRSSMILDATIYFMLMRMASSYKRNIRVWKCMITFFVVGYGVQF